MVEALPKRDPFFNAAAKALLLVEAIAISPATSRIKKERHL